MYYEKLIPILSDIENKDIEIAGGSVVLMNLSITNSLIDYICNLTIDKKKYENVREEIVKIKQQCEILRKKNLEEIDEDVRILKMILERYKRRKKEPEKLEEIYKKSAEFCLQVTENALSILKLAKKISQIGNKMLKSDFRICIMYAYTSVKAEIENVKINVYSVKDESYQKEMTEKYKKLQKEADEIYNNE